ncbi:hypothetical protein AWB74_06243 [Caballeronia arvi]|uniref:Uncharacterized protein n=1 Tax=Caballeronia arvi TaxID=1777135 RepID=A0A158KP39_9BURK|nr:hypothetical protein AWB74_06243 [Caballeronia arvi]
MPAVVVAGNLKPRLLASRGFDLLSGLCLTTRFSARRVSSKSDRANLIAQLSDAPPNLDFKG